MTDHPYWRHSGRESSFCRNPFRIEVKSPTGHPVKGAEVTFFDVRGRVIHKAYSGSAGIAQLNLLAGASYTLAQTYSPLGLDRDPRHFHLTVTKACRFIINGKPVGGVRLINRGAPEECADCRNAKAAY